MRTSSADPAGGRGLGEQDAPDPRLPTLRRWLERAQVDRAVMYVLLTHGWQMLAGPVTLFAVARYYSPETQGFFYTFASLLALQSFVELGFYVVILNVASHEWSHLGLDPSGRIEGDAHRVSRLVSLGRLIFKWYAGASFIFVVGVSAIGYVLLSQQSHPDVDWQAPWLVLVALTALLLWIQPFGSLLEGCGQIVTVNRFRLIQYICANAALWWTIAGGGELWAAVAFAAGMLGPGLYLLLVKYKVFFRQLIRVPTGPGIDWYTEIWPMQWRLAASGVVNYFANSLAVPVIFHYHGAVAAGQMGMTRMVVNAILTMALAGVQTKVPRFGRLIAKQRYRELDRLWFRSSLVSLAAISAGAVSLWLAVWFLDALDLAFADRLLSPLPTGLFLLAAVLLQVSWCQTAYLRAHKQEPILVMGVTTSLATGLAVWWLGGRFGPLGAAAGTLAVMVVVVIWETAIWLRCRKLWHLS